MTDAMRTKKQEGLALADDTKAFIDNPKDELFIRFRKAIDYYDLYRSFSLYFFKDKTLDKFNKKKEILQKNKDFNTAYVDFSDRYSALRDVYIQVKPEDAESPEKSITSPETQEKFISDLKGCAPILNAMMIRGSTLMKDISNSYGETPDATIYKNFSAIFEMFLLKELEREYPHKTINTTEKLIEKLFKYQKRVLTNTKELNLYWNKFFSTYEEVAERVNGVLLDRIKLKYDNIKRVEMVMGQCLKMTQDQIDPITVLPFTLNEPQLLSTVKTLEMYMLQQRDAITLLASTYPELFILKCFKETRDNTIREKNETLMKDMMEGYTAFTAACKSPENEKYKFLFDPTNVDNYKTRQRAEKFSVFLGLRLLKTEDVLTEAFVNDFCSYLHYTYMSFVKDNKDNLITNLEHTNKTVIAGGMLHPQSSVAEYFMMIREIIYKPLFKASTLFLTKKKDLENGIVGNSLFVVNGFIEEDTKRMIEFMLGPFTRDEGFKKRVEQKTNLEVEKYKKANEAKFFIYKVRQNIKNCVEANITADYHKIITQQVNRKYNVKKRTESTLLGNMTINKKKVRGVCFSTKDTMKKLYVKDYEMQWNKLHELHEMNEPDKKGEKSDFEVITSADQVLPKPKKEEEEESSDDSESQGGTSCSRCVHNSNVLVNQKNTTSSSEATETDEPSSVLSSVNTSASSSFNFGNSSCRVLGQGPTLAQFGATQNAGGENETILNSNNTIELVVRIVEPYIGKYQPKHPQNVPYFSPVYLDENKEEELSADLIQYLTWKLEGEKSEYKEIGIAEIDEYYKGVYDKAVASAEENMTEEAKEAIKVLIRMVKEGKETVEKELVEKQKQMEEERVKHIKAEKVENAKRKLEYMKMAMNKDPRFRKEVQEMPNTYIKESPKPKTRARQSVQPKVEQVPVPVLEHSNSDGKNIEGYAIDRKKDEKSRQTAENCDTQTEMKVEKKQEKKATTGLAMEQKI
ncbi:hypothetical protein EIN_116310 [Entamoeba invadens IP1]|uniref:Uncharacterized protein n=1 Tax=Entamoeba invadens IP1 TaxID=370355 RepID=L7FPD1_ENTIV|nr:hypothetical protein EIN_116310 [Entamoeba invadens IP1]ELP94530.1 hypothetical protein EIN_116310 [Entamoeba invadens IP1]|eukprot:XP_004261301.1 hypothetical protein EIN_116310 [Entamoeba invadens IP1]